MVGRLAGVVYLPLMKCDRCGKGVLVGMNVSHSHIRTKKRSYPNLHAFKIKAGGVTRRLRLCTKCLRIVKKQQVAISAKKVDKSLVVEDQKAPEEKTTLSEDIEKATIKKSKKPTNPHQSPV